MTHLEMLDRLSGGIADNDLHFRIGNIIRDGDRVIGATALVYISAATVIRILNDSGLEWSDEYEVYEGTIRGRSGPTRGYYATCKLTVNGVTREDVGEGDYPKDAISDAIKRAARKFRIGEELYEGEVLLTPDEFTRNGRITAPKEVLIARWRGEADNPDIWANARRYDRDGGDGDWGRQRSGGGRSYSSGSGGGGSSRPITQRQRRTIENILNRNPDIIENAEAILERLDDMSSAEASQVISTLFEKLDN